MSKASQLEILLQLGCNVSPFVAIKRIEDINYHYSNLSHEKYYAVRSSANLEDSNKYSFAGIFDSFLNIPYKDLHKFIHKVFDFSNNDRLRSYLSFLNLDASLLNMEVLIQEMIDCEKAGVAFSQNPMNNDSNIYLEALWGLGEAGVSGKVFCDKIQSKKNGQIISYEVGFQEKKLICCSGGGTEYEALRLIDQSKKKLSRKEVLVIVDAINQLSSSFKYPFEIEWGFTKNDFYIFQLRPITALKE